MQLPDRSDTICALATAPGMGAIAVIRISGSKTFEILNGIFESKSGKKKDFNSSKSHTLHFGNLLYQHKIIDEVLISVFKNPMSYTGEDTIEISCHGSTYIQQQLLVIAEPGEFTMRAFLNGKLDLTQAEAVADLISSQHASAHTTAIQQLRGGYNSTIQSLRQQLMDFASLIELELDFAEEDVEFANRDQLRALINGLLKEVKKLRNSFDTGNAMKNGIPVVIAGKPNVGKSTLLNALLNEEKAIVSEIAGTTRDVVEDQLIIEGYRFRFMDTAGIRQTTDAIEKIGVAKTYSHTEKASIALYLCDPAQSNPEEILKELEELKLKSGNSTISIITVVNKTDQFSVEALLPYHALPASIFISAKNKTHLDELKKLLIFESGVANKENENQLVTNARHASSLLKAETALTKVIEGMDENLTSDFLALELKEALYQLGNITGEIYTDDLLGNIFSKFCIGK